MSYIIYKLISYLSSKIDISGFTYSGEDNNLNKVEISWFNAKNYTNYGHDKYENLYYRFKINIDYFNNSKPKLSGYILILNKRDILFIDRIKILHFFIREYIKDIICDKIKATRDKRLPIWFLRKYIFPNTIFI